MVSASVCLTTSLHALDPHKATPQYKHDSWTVETGFPGGQVTAIAQTGDGYLWIGTDKGLLRFDGLKFVQVKQSDSAQLPLASVLGLATDGEGDLWVRLQGLNLVRRHGQSFEPPTPPIDAVTALCRGKDGGMLMSSLTLGIVSYQRGRMETLAPPEVHPNSVALSIAETSDGRVWIGTRDDGLFYLDHGALEPVKEGLPDRKINSLLPTGDGRLWVGTDNGMALWNGSRIVASEVPAVLRGVQILTMAKDGDANIWIGTKDGLLRLSNSGAVTGPAGAPTAVSALVEDREGNVWAGSVQGLERLRDSAFVTYSIADGLPADSNGPIYVAPDGRAWFAPATGGLYRMKDKKVERVNLAGLDNDIVYSIAGNRNDVWVGRQTGGLTHIFPRGSALAAETYTHADGLAQNSVYSVHVERDGTVWAGTLSGGVSRLKDGGFTTYKTADGLASNTVVSIEDGQDGAIWFATSRGLSKLTGGHWRTYSASAGLPSNAPAIALFEDSSGILWVGTAEGLAFLDSNGTRILHFSPELLREPVVGLAEDASGYLWVSTTNHVLRISRERLLGGEVVSSDIRQYGLADGLLGTEGVKRDRSVAADSQGRLWFSMNRGISVVDPGRDKSPAAIAQIEAISADGNAVALQEPVQVPASQQRVVIDYTGLSLSIPERVRFRYRLDGFDRGWSDPVAVREAVYTNLSPGIYRFRVVASNSSGLWNGSEAAIQFTIAPAFWQTWWFQLSCFLALACLGWFIYRLRLHQMAKQLNLRFDERLAERMRIAHELHDTLLQGFLSASMQLHVASDHVPESSPAKPQLGRVLQLMADVTEEGRKALRGLRSGPQDLRPLEEALSLVPQEFIVEEEIDFRVIVEGSTRLLHPVIRDEVYRIGREALVNAFRHSRARMIEVEIEYASSYLHVMVRDNGCGIDRQVVDSGREGHWGLPGMRERSEGIGAKLRVMSGAETGTEVELTVPGGIAYQGKAGKSAFGRLVRLYPSKRQEPGGEE